VTTELHVNSMYVTQPCEKDKQCALLFFLS
jgi:hypothetical protein